MEDSKDGSFDLMAEYGRTLFASRVVGTVIILFAGVWFYGKCLQMAQAWEIFENMIEGGAGVLPVLTRTLARYSSSLAAAVAVGALGGLGVIWFSGGRISRVLYGTLGGVLVPLIVGMMIDQAFNGPMMDVITHFQP